MKPQTTISPDELRKREEFLRDVLSGRNEDEQAELLLRLDTDEGLRLRLELLKDRARDVDAHLKEVRQAIRALEQARPCPEDQWIALDKRRRELTEQKPKVRARRREVELEQKRRKKGGAVGAPDWI